MKKWEYCTILSTHIKDKTPWAKVTKPGDAITEYENDDAKIGKIMNDLGVEGWEAFEVDGHMEFFKDGIVGFRVVFLKRPAQDKPKTEKELRLHIDTTPSRPSNK